MDPRKILGVDRNATRAEIQRAYRHQVSKYHPDRGGDAWVFQQVNDAYERLIQELDGTAPTTKTKKPTGSPTSAGSQSNEKPPNENRSDSPDARRRKSEPHRQSQPQQNSESRKKPQPATDSKQTNRTKPAKQSSNDQHSTASRKPQTTNWRKLFGNELPLQNETTIFILVNVLDVFMTYILLRFEAIEANPLAKFFLATWGMRGMITFKLVIVAFVCVISQVIALYRIQTARWLLILGTAAVGAVVIYSCWLLTHKIL